MKNGRQSRSGFWRPGELCGVPAGVRGAGLLLQVGAAASVGTVPIYAISTCPM